jgi:hypothetical protein
VRELSVSECSLTRWRKLLDFKIAEREDRAVIPPDEIEWQGGLESYISSPR